MENAKLQGFKSFLTEHFTALAVEVFGEVESMMESCYEENKRLRSILHMVLSPEIKLPRIDASLYTESTAVTAKQRSEANTTPELERSEPLSTEPKEEKIECEISWEPGQQEWPEGEETFQIAVCVKDDPDEEEEKMSVITETDREVAEPRLQSTTTGPAYNNGSEQEGCSSPEVDEAAHASFQVLNEDGTSLQTNPETTSTNMSKFSKQKTVLQVPRMVLDKSYSVSRADQESFLERLSDSFRDFPDDQKPLICHMGLQPDGEWVECALGPVPKGSPLSYQCPLPSSRDFKPWEDAPPQPLLPFFDHALEPASVFPILSTKEHAFLNAMKVTWEEAHSLEESTRGSKEAADEVLMMRLTSRFREICNLKPGRSHAEQLLYNIQRGLPRCKTSKIDAEMKPEAIREYCRHLCVNFSPCGLVVHPCAPWMGAIPDGLVYDPKETSRFGLVHIKYVGIKSIAECPFLICRKGVLELNRSHQYYWQMQGEMMVTSTPWCDLLLHSREDLLVQRIYRNEPLIRLMKKKLEEFFFHYYLPNLI